MFFVYILESISTGKYYIGQTNNLENRLKSHNQDHNKYTSGYKPWKIIFNKKFLTRQEAMVIEKEIKSLKNRELVIKFVNNNQFESFN